MATIGQTHCVSKRLNCPTPDLPISGCRRYPEPVPVTTAMATIPKDLYDLGEYGGGATRFW